MTSARHGAGCNLGWILTIVLGVSVLTQASSSQHQFGLSIELSQAAYQPGMAVSIRVEVAAGLLETLPARLVMQITRLTDVVETQYLDVTKADASTESFAWLPPVEPAGYGITVHLEQDGEVIVTAESAVDVATDWTEQPRYGFVSEFGGWDEPHAHEAFRAMNRLHLNGLQFYDWLYRHEQPVPPGEAFIDSMGRALKVETIREKIGLARNYGMTPMAYVAIYAASPGFHAHNREWGLYDKNGEPIEFGEGYLYIMDPTRGRGWDEHLIREFRQVLRDFDFGGLHIDQYGFPKVAYNTRGQTVLIAPAFRTFINDTKAAVAKEFPDRSTVAFNSVANWPVAVVAKSDYDFNYVEVWPPYSTYGDIETIIQSAYETSGGRATVIAAYVDARHEATVLLLDAIIFAHGATHIELGEGNGLLTDPYFPKFARVSDPLWQALVAYYDFIVRYKDWLYAPRQLLAANQLVLIDGEAAAPRPERGHVHAILYRAQHAQRHVLSLINLTTADTVEWKAAQPEPVPIDAIEMTVTVDYEPSHLWLASPDKASLAAAAVPFTKTRTEEGWAVQFFANVHYWSVAVIE